MKDLSFRSHGTALAIAIVLTLVGLALRIDGIADRVLAHPENFAPGIDVPDWVRLPPDRLTIGQVLRSTMIDGHPPTYFLAMLPWVNSFGSGLTSLRLPSALTGALCVWLLWLIGRRETDEPTALLSAGLLALHGYAIFWSQLARMYAPAACLGLLSTLFLIRVARQGRRIDHILYFLFTAFALWTQLYAWPLVAAQLLWCVFGTPVGRRAAIRTGILALAASAPVVQLSMRQNPATNWQVPPGGYFEFGYIYPDLPFWGTVPWRPSGAWITALCLILLAAGVFAAIRATRIRGEPENSVVVEPWARWLDWALAALVGVAMLLLAWRWIGINSAVWAVSMLPLLMVACLRPVTWLIDRIHSRFHRFTSEVGQIPLSAFLALIPVGLMAAVSLKRGVYVPRGTIVFLPFLLLLVAGGLVNAIRSTVGSLRLAGIAATAVVVGLFAASVNFVRSANSSPRDYGSAMKELARIIRPDDIVLVRNDYVHAPLFYYLDRSYDSQLIHDYDRFISDAPPGGRIWLVQACAEHMGMKPEVRSLNFQRRIPFVGLELWLLQRPGQGSQPPTPMPATCITPPDSTRKGHQ